MKNKFLSLIMAAALMNSSVALRVCECAAGDCSFSTRSAVKTERAHCHHESASPKEGAPSGKRCCGNCQIEKTAVLAEKAFNLNPVRSGEGTTVPALFPAISDMPPTDVFSRSYFYEPPGSFFLQHIFNTSISFRAPPRGVDLLI